MSDLTTDITERERLASRLLDAMGFDERLRQNYARLAKRRAARPAIHSEARSRLDAILEARQRVITPELVRPPMVARYVARFTEDELRELIAFHESPVGQKLVQCWGGEDSELQKVIADATEAHSADFAELMKQFRVP